MSAAKKIEQIRNYDDVPLKPKAFERLALVVKDMMGVNLPPTEKNYSLVKNRLTRILRTRGLGSFEELAELMENRPAIDLREQFISAMTTNKTHFFREDAHFEFLKKELSTHFQKNSELLIWCAAASTGQEPYTIAMVVAENIEEHHLKKCKILATDIDLEVLKRSVEGRYTEAEMDGCPTWLRKKYFDYDKKNQTYRAKDILANLLHFSRFNLIHNSYEFKKQFHFVFCRNVLIYFDPPTTKKVISQLASTVAPGGHLILGHSESGTVNDPQLKAMSQATYRKI